MKKDIYSESKKITRYFIYLFIILISVLTPSNVAFVIATTLIGMYIGFSICKLI
ncbi:MAG: hypothetical protein IJ399_04675 [Bacilli bacterium]|nr:hypothetical protein [Bacilli bacterium]